MGRRVVVDDVPVAPLTSDGLALAQVPMGNIVAFTLFRLSVPRIDRTCAGEPESSKVSHTYRELLPHEDVFR
jgi:hypothetical protein